MGCSVSISRNHHDNTIEQPPPPPPPPASSSLTHPPTTVSLVHHPPDPLKKGDTHHLVSLTSTSYGLIHDSKLLHHPTSTSSDSVINTWELMADLDDDHNDLDHSNSTPIPSSSKIITQGFPTSPPPPPPPPPPESKPLWQHLSEEVLLLSDMDPNVGSSFRRALLSLSNMQQLQLATINNPTPSSTATTSSGGAKISPFPPLFDKRNNKVETSATRIVIYYTSLRGIQRTYEDCCFVRSIFKGFRVSVDERDVSMDSSYRKELQTALLQLMGHDDDKKKNSNTVVMRLPHVFIGGKHVGGAEEIKQLHDDGELAKLLQGFPVVGEENPPGSVCGSCGDARFVPCFNCNGSRKVFHRDQLNQCPYCNENGLIRCPICCLQN